MQHELPVVVTEHRWSGLDVHEPGAAEASSFALDGLRGERLSVLTGIGNPDAFVAMAIDFGAQIVHRWDCPDHAHFSDAVLERLKKESNAIGAGYILVSPKDWTKLKEPVIRKKSFGSMPVLVPRLELGFRSDRMVLDGVLGSIFDPGSAAD